MALVSPGELARRLGVPEPTPEQAKVIAAPLGPMAVVAGAGSGKSETMAARVVWLVANGLVRPERILGLTFTRKAAAELGTRIRRRLDQLRPHEDLVDPALLDGEPSVSTYHAYAARLLGDHALREALEPTMRLVTEAVAWQIASRAVDSYNGPMDAVEWTPDTVTKAVLQLAGDLSEHLRSPDDVRETGAWLAERFAALGKVTKPQRDVLAKQETREHLLPIVEAYQRLKRNREVIDHGDQVALAARIARNHPEVGVVERSRYAAVLLDEYQDTSHAQLVLLRALFAGGHPVTAVGDPCQSIYGWRGASAANLLRFTRDFPQARQRSRDRNVVPAPIERLSVSFRNSERILDAAARVQQDLRAEAAAVPRLYPGPDRQGRGRVECALFETVEDEAAWIAARLKALFRAGGDPDQPPAASATSGGVGGTVPGPAGGAEQAEEVAESASGRAGEAVPGAAGEAVSGAAGEAVSGPSGGAEQAEEVAGSRRGEDGPETGEIRYADVAVLARKRSQFPLLRKVLEERGIPVEVVGLGGLLTVPEVQDVVATLKVAADPAAGASLVRLLTGPRWRIGPRDLIALGKRARELAREQARDVIAEGEAGGTPDGPVDEAAGDPPSGLGPVGGPPQGAATGRGTPARAGDAGPPDPLQQTVEELARESGSLVDALDDLGPAGPYSPEGHARMRRLSNELRQLRTQLSLPLPDLVTEVERILALDIEVASRPGRDPVSARADLDSFADAASRFAGDAEDPTLGAFLAYLAAAEEEERGLETAGRVGDADSVKLLTVHAAKGLEWPVVLIPGLSSVTQRDGVPARGSIFPAKPQQSTRWTTNPRLLPFPLRGDADDLPRLDGLEKTDLAEFDEACGERAVREERRLAYVAMTRASALLIGTGYWWGSARSPLGPSPFLTEITEHGEIMHWAPEPEEGTHNPLLAEPETAAWPVPPARDAVASGARMVREAMTGRVRQWASSYHELPDTERSRISAWARDAELLLAERDRGRRGDGLAVELPVNLSVSTLVDLAGDADALARRIRRPMPRQPAPYARRGTTFHQWLESRWGQQRLIDMGELPGAADDSTTADEQLEILKTMFEMSDWALRDPVDVEVPFATVVGDRLVRGRMDAVFRDGGGYEVVDWKTGSPPSGLEAEAAAVQLAAYRLAWADLAGVPVEQVSAAFHYVRAGQTVRPADLLTRPGLAALLERIPAV